MSLVIFEHDADTNDGFDKTPHGVNCSFKIGFHDNCQKDDHLNKFPLIQGKRITEIKGIADETVGFSYSTGWGVTPSAKLLGKLQEFTRADAFKIFGGENFDNNPATDKWTQQVPNDGSVISASFKFRAYYKAGFGGANSYQTIIQWLTFATSPLHETDFMTEWNNIVNALQQAKSAGEDFSKEMNALKNEKTKTLSKDAIQVLKTGFEKITSMLNDSRGGLTFYLEFGNIFKKSFLVDWVIDSWSFTPSVQMGPNNCPLWCDFEVSMSTNEKISANNIQTRIK